jgi:hypothetical protein
MRVDATDGAGDSAVEPEMARNYQPLAEPGAVTGSLAVLVGLPVADDGLEPLARLLARWPALTVEFCDIHLNDGTWRRDACDVRGLSDQALLDRKPRGTRGRLRDPGRSTGEYTAVNRIWQADKMSRAQARRGQVSLVARPVAAAPLFRRFGIAVARRCTRLLLIAPIKPLPPTCCRRRA